MNFQPVKVGLLLRTLASMPENAAIYVLLPHPDGSERRAPLLSVGTLRDENVVELGGAHAPE